jgi:uncharacterized membrane protein
MATYDNYLMVLIVIAALDCGLVAGIFLAFSSFVMKALASLPANQGIAAMQAINITVLNPLFFTVFFGTAAVCILLIILSLFSWGQLGSIYVLLGSLFYVIGTIWVTMAFNVPLNNELANVNSDSSGGADVWASYLAKFTTWNHIRATAALAASLLLLIGGLR